MSLSWKFWCSVTRGIKLWSELKVITLHDLINTWCSWADRSCFWNMKCSFKVIYITITFFLLSAMFVLGSLLVNLMLPHSYTISCLVWLSNKWFVIRWNSYFAISSTASCVLAAWIKALAYQSSFALVMERKVERNAY